jgi:hypothetical protein
MWRLIPLTPTVWQAEVEGSCFKTSLAKKKENLARPYLKVQTVHAGISVSLPLEEMEVGGSWSKTNISGNPI